ncbi:MAG: hydroxymethylpyrimidine/phosphomethylpyrimidine kinase [Novosphingobium sp.]
MPPPRILVIAGSDSSGGAGIQADIKTITMIGGYAMTAINAITAQNTLGVTAVEVLSPELIAAQIDACVSDIGVDAVKIGMLGSPEIAAVVAERLEALSVPVVFDPVMIATSGAALADAATIAGFERLMRLATLTTPNLPELAVLANVETFADDLQAEDAAETVMKRSGAPAMLVKGGHWPDGMIYGKTDTGLPYKASSDDLLFDALYTLSPEGYWQTWSFHHKRIHTRHTHGTGCTLSSTIATYLGRGLDLPEAVDRARLFVRSALRAAPGFGAGHGPLGHTEARG